MCLPTQPLLAVLASLAALVPHPMCTVVAQTSHAATHTLHLPTGVRLLSKSTHAMIRTGNLGSEGRRECPRRESTSTY